MTVCGTGRAMSMRPADFAVTLGTPTRFGFDRQVAEDLVEHGGGGIGVDGADDGDLEVVASEGLGAERLQIVDGDRRDAVGGAVDGVAVGMVGERRLAQRLAGKPVGVALAALDRR